MKKLLIIVIALTLCLVAVSCGSEGGLIDEFDFENDFSNAQGYRNWYYLYGNTDGDLNYMTFDLDEGKWRGKDFYSKNGINEQHPGNNTETIIGFYCDRNGEISVQGSVTRCPVDWMGDGLFFYAAYYSGSLSDEYLTSFSIDALEKKPYEYEFTKKVKKGDFIYFAVNANGNNSYDSVRNSINIKYN
ncbi:MAG: hypothetical protein ACI4S9_07405 [Christensenellales bacterium]